MQSALPDPSRVVATPSAVEAVAVAPRPEPSICTVACAAPSSPLSASAPAWAEQPPAVIAQSAAASVARVARLAPQSRQPPRWRGSRCAAPLAVVAAVPVQPVAPRVAPGGRVGGSLLVHPHPGGDVATTRGRAALGRSPSPHRCAARSDRRPRSPQWHRSCHRLVAVAAGAARVARAGLRPAVALRAQPVGQPVDPAGAGARRTLGRLLPRDRSRASRPFGGPVVSPLQPPPEERHAIVAPSLVARVLAPPSPLPNSNRAFATTASSPSPLRLDELHDPAFRSHDALAVLSPDPADTPHPDDTPAKATHLSP